MTEKPGRRLVWAGRAGYAVLLLALLYAAAVVLFSNLESAWVEKYDELRHAVIAYEMVINDDYLVNTYFGETDYFNLKPPLSMWAIALSYHLAGFTLEAVRLPSAIASFLMLAVGALWLKRRQGAVASLVYVGAMTAFKVLIAGHYARNGDPDALYQLFFTIAMLCMLDSRRNFRWFYGSALCFALAFLTKSWHALCIPVICFLFLACEGRLKEITWKRAGLLIAVGIVPVLPWAVARYLRDGWAFLTSGVSVDIGERMLSGTASGPLLYFEYLLSDRGFKIALALCAASALTLVLTRTRLSPLARSAVIGCLLWLLVPPVLFSFSNFKKYWYVFSSFTALAVLLGVLLQALLARGSRNVTRGLGAALTVLTAALCVAGIWQNVDTILTTVNPHHYQVGMMELLDRESYAGAHAYIQYNEKNADGSPITDWADEDRFMAELYGDVICLPGGKEAFEQDGEYALIMIGNLEQLDVRDELAGFYIPLLETRYVSVFCN